MLLGNVDGPWCGSDEPNYEPARMYVSEQAKIINQAELRNNLLHLESSTSQLMEENAQMMEKEKSQDLDIKELRTEKTRHTKQVEMLRQSVRKTTQVEIELTELWNLLSEEQSIRKTEHFHKRRLEKEQKVLMEQERITAQLASLRVQREKDEVETNHLRTTLQALQCEMGEAKRVLNNEDEFIMKQNLSMTLGCDELQNLSNIITDLRQTHQDLRSQLESKEEDEILAGMGCYFAGEEELLGSSAADERGKTLLQTPAAEVQDKSWWRHCAEGLLKGTCTAGVLTLSVLLPLGVMASVVPASSSSALHLLWSYCELHHVALPPF